MLGEMVASEIFEARILAHKHQPAGANGAVALLAQDNFRGALVRAVLVVHLIAVDKGNYIGILLNGTRFAQIRVYRAFIGPLFNITTKLRQRNHWALIFPRQPF